MGSPHHSYQSALQKCFGSKKLTCFLLLCWFVLSKIPYRNSASILQSSEQSLTAQPQVSVLYNVDSPTHNPMAVQQIENFRSGNGLLLNFHIVHHGGTTFCREIGRRLKAPSFVCLKPRDDKRISHLFKKETRPWSHEDTASNISFVKKHFNMISWEFYEPPSLHRPQIPDTDWEDPRLLSVIIMRDPISRLLAGSADIKSKYPFLQINDTEDTWWQYAKTENAHNDNFALRILAGYPCCNGTNTPREYLENAKALVKRFSVVLDIECLDAGMVKLAQLIGIEMNMEDLNSYSKTSKIKSEKHRNKSPLERIHYPKVYNYLVDKNRLDIELYEWSKSLALANCSAIEASND